MTFRRLLWWGDLEAGRRRDARRGILGWPKWVYVALASALLFAEAGRRLGAFGGDADSGAASEVVLVVLALTGAIAALGAPFRMYWRHDAALLARLPLPGRALFGLALARQLRATAAWMVPAAIAALAFAVWGDPALAFFHVVLAVAAFCVAGALAPAAALLAGRIAASEEAHHLIAGVTGEVAAPRTGWLGVLPGVVAAAVILVVVAGAGWARGASAVTEIGPPWMLVAVAVVPSLVAVLWAVAAAGEVMSRAAAEVAALDRQILAHIERVPASAIERAWSKIWLRDGGARAVFDKDARLLRRRYPLATLAVFVATIALWICAWRAPDNLAIEAAILAAMGAFSVILYRRLIAAPLEAPRLLASLPIAPAAAIAAKRALVFLRAGTVAIAGGAPAILRAENPALTAAVLTAIFALTIATITTIHRPPP